MQLLRKPGCCFLRKANTALPQPASPPLRRNFRRTETGTLRSSFAHSHPKVALAPRPCITCAWTNSLQHRSATSRNEARTHP